MSSAEQTHITTITHTPRSARSLDACARIGWEVERDVIRGRRFHFRQRFLPDGLARIGKLEFLWPDELRLLNQVQARTYANMVGLAERFIGAKLPAIRRAPWSDNQIAVDALTCFADEGLKHQAMFSRIEELVAQSMPYGYRFAALPRTVVATMTAASTWALLALTRHIELLTQAHHLLSLEPDSELAPLYKDALLFHWIEESEHASFDELEWFSENARLSPVQRDDAINELIGLFFALDEIVRTQACADTRYFLETNGRALDGPEAERVGQVLLHAYRWQHIVCAVQHPHFIGLLDSLLSDKQVQRFGTALAPLMT
jgi:hypothetical protein